MCEVCSEFVGLLLSYGDKLSEHFYETAVLKKCEVEIFYQFIHSFNQRQCLCVFRDVKNFERFSNFSQAVIYVGILELKDLIRRLSTGSNTPTENEEKTIKEDGRENLSEEGKPCEENAESWNLQEKEKLLNFISKLFLLNFPLYQAYKLSCHSKSDEIPHLDVPSVNAFCEITDVEVPYFLIRNVTLFCKTGGFQLITKCFEGQTFETLPVSLAHALTSVVCNVKLWLNVRSIMALFVPVRSNILKYMCSLQDKDLRLPGIKNTAEYMWNAVKEPFDSPPIFDRDGLELAFKYFTSSTLTMRLAGIAQINSYISVFNELCNNENMVEVESVGQSLADWLIEVQIISHIFGPNLHVEVIKQSHIILNFLAMECKITNEHIDIIWQASQLKHCSKQVHDLLPPFINNLETGPVLHLYNLLCKLEPRDHTEQSLFLASALIKFIWTSGGTYHVANELPFLNVNKVTLSGLKDHGHELTSSENSVSPEASVTEDDHADSSHQSEPQKSMSDESEGPIPCKKKRSHFRDDLHQNRSGNTSDESLKVEDADEEEDDDDDEDDNEEEEEEDDEEEEEILGNPSVMSQAHSLALMQQRLLNKGKRSKRNSVNFLAKDNSEAGTLKTDALLKEVSIKLWKDYMSKRSASKLKNGEANGKELVKELLRCERKIEPRKEKKKERQERPGSDDDADGEKSGNEDTAPKSKKKVLKKRKFSEAIKSETGGNSGSKCGGENEDTEESENESGILKGQKGKKPEKRKSLSRDKSKSEEEKSLEENSGNPPGMSLSCSMESNGVINELASMVRGDEIHDCASFLVDIHQGRDVEEMSMEEGGSYSSRMSNKSEKNLGDFEEDSGCEEEELAQLAAKQVQLSNLTYHPVKMPCRSGFTRINTHFKIDDVCKPGNTLLWDLLQDDKIEQLGENLAAEAEKILSNLLCYNTERLIRMKFIEGCLENLSTNWSVVVSLRLLPKLFASFQEFRGTNTHSITTWAEHKLHMMKHFFNNLQVYSLEGPKFYSHQTEINVRLQFLSSVFSPLGSPYCFRLSLNQVDTLWSCLATDPQCSDELFSWLLNNARSKGHQHALGIDALKYLYMKKLPSLPPETMSIVGLTLFQQLHNLARFAFPHADSNAVRDVDVVGMDYLWKVALKANKTDISMSAIQYINQYYMSRNLEHEEEFISQCMSYLASASLELSTSEESSLLCIQRALVLLKTHLETFKRRYAYHLRRWMLEGKSVGSHVQIMSGDRGCVPLRIHVQPAGLTEKVTLELLSSDYVAELRAEIAKWWESIPKKLKDEKDNSSLGSLMTDGPIRMITQGQELTTELDEKTLQEIMLKDSQFVYVSVGASRPLKMRDASDSPSMLPPPARENLPTLLLLQDQYFEQLFHLMQTLSAMKTTVKGGHQIPHTKAQVLSRRVWDILTLLPTSPKLLEGFQNLETSSDVTLQELLDPSTPQKLMYSLYIVESLCRVPSNKRQEALASSDREKEDLPRSWSAAFVKQGGLRHLFDIFMSGTLQRGDGSEWQQDCLASLLKLLCQLGMTLNDNRGESSENEAPAKNKAKKAKKSNLEKPVPQLNEAMLQMLNVDGVMARLTSILYDASLPRDPNHYKTGFWGRAQVVHYAMSLLVSWVHSGDSVRERLFNTSNLSLWLKRLVLEDPEPAVRREVCTALYRLCLCTNGLSDSTDTSQSLVTPMLTKLFEFLPTAESMGPQKYEHPLHQTIEDGKEPYGPACRDYFWLLCRLVDSLSQDLVKESIEDPQGCLLDIDALARSLANSIMTRDFLESRHNTVEDSGLIGLLNLETNVVKHFPPFKTSKEGQEFLVQLFEFLFALPNPKKRFLPKCKSQLARSSTYDLLVEMVRSAPENYLILHEKVLRQHQQGPHYLYPWDYWPHEDVRSDCGYVGLTNLGATCYMASCMQHLYMMPQARTSILDAKCDSGSKHEETLRELQRMFAYLLESERKAYNPRSFCKVYTMDHQPLNTGEQKDMAEFFIDLVSKLEEMTPELKKLVKTLFGGVISNNVVSLDCGHVSRTLEEFYTVRCQVTDMRNIYESLDEVTVKDTLEGDNMYTCSQCGKKVRAEKRACFKKLPHILCFNTMRYTFNMITMLKEKVNTLFSFPLRLDMSGYVEKHLMPQYYQEEKLKSQLGKSEDASSGEKELNEKYEYDLIGVTVHTGTADGGHYYSFIRDRTTPNRDKWFLFNDAEVKPFDPNQLAAECFGGEMTSKTYDSVNDKFMDFSFEKTNSAYMLFYEWCSESGDQRGFTEEGFDPCETEQSSSKEAAEQKTVVLPQFELSKDLEDWIWRDNMHFLRDKNIFEHTYFNFMWQICGQIPQTLVSQTSDITELAAELSTSFFLETYIHAKEKPMMVQWVELVTKQFVSSRAACEWFLGHMARNDWWPVQILIKCPNQMIRQMFQRLCIHVIQQLKQSHVTLYLRSDPEEESVEDSEPVERLGNDSCVTLFVKKLLGLLDHGTTKAHLKNLTEYFVFLYEFSKMGEIESQFLIAVQAISKMVNFYLGHKATDFVEILSEEEDEEDAIPSGGDKYKPVSLEKMITLIASLVEKSRGPENRLKLTQMDMNAIAGGKWFPFIYQQTKDAINLNQTRNLIFALCQYNERLAQMIVTMIFQTIARHTEVSEVSFEALRPVSSNMVCSTSLALFQISQPFLKLLTLLTDPTNLPSAYTTMEGMPCFSQLVLQGIWDVAEICPIPILDWLAVQVARNPLAHTLVLQNLDQWVEPYLMQSCNQRVRTAAAYLLVSLVPNAHFRQCYRSARGLMHPRELLMNQEAQSVLHEIYMLLLRKLKVAKKYSDIQDHGPTKLTSYFTLLLYFCPTKTEKLMFGPFFMDLWTLFLPNLSEPSISVHYNKQALLSFWHHVCVDCPENVNLILNNQVVTKNIAFNYILADHEDQEIVMFNRAMLPAYYGLLRLCCQQSRQFTRHLANHQNLNWAFKNITPYPSQYAAAVEELFKLMHLFATRHPDMSEQEINDVNIFRKSTIQIYLEHVDPRTSWATLISAFRILVESEEEKLFVVYNNGIQVLFECFQTLHTVYHESANCHVSTELLELLNIITSIMKILSEFQVSKSGGSGSTGGGGGGGGGGSGGGGSSPPIACKDAKTLLMNCKDWVDVIRKLATLQNSYNPSEMRNMALDLLKEILLIMPREVIQVLTPLLSHCHSAFQESSTSAALPMGPYFPRKGIKPPGFAIKTPRRPMVQMAVPNTQIEPKGQNEEYDMDLLNYYTPYHSFIDVMCRLAINHNCMSEALIQLSAIVGFEGVPLHFTFFPKLWLDIYAAQQLDKKYISILLSNNFFIDYIETILLDERTCLNVPVIYKFLHTFFPKVASRVLSDNTCQIVDNLVTSLNQKVQHMDVSSTACRLNADLRALELVYSNVEVPIAPPNNLIQTLLCLVGKVRVARNAKESRTSRGSKTADVGSDGVVRNQEEEGEREKSAEGGKSRVQEPGTSSREGKGNGTTAGTKKSDPQPEPGSSAGPSIDWLSALENTITHLIATLNKSV